MDRATAIDKVRKCLALSKSAEPHEAGAALRQAQKLMAQFGLDGDDLELSQVQQQSKPARPGALSSWESLLADVVKDAFGCGVIWTRQLARIESRWGQADRRTYRRTVIFYGPAAGVELAGYVWDVLLRQVMRARKAHIDAQPHACKTATLTARGDRFASGWVCGVRDQVERMATGSAVRQELLAAYARSTWPETTEVKATRRDAGRNVRADDFARGARAGAAADLRRGVGAGAQAPRLGGSE